MEDLSAVTPRLHLADLYNGASDGEAAAAEDGGSVDRETGEAMETGPA